MSEIIRLFVKRSLLTVM